MDIIITTSLSRYGFAIVSADGLCEIEKSYIEISGNIFSVLDDLLEENSLSLLDVERIFVDIGPGGTSSVRSGVSIANTIGYVTKAEIFPILSSQIILQQNSDVQQQANRYVIHRSIRGHVYISHVSNGELGVQYQLLKTFVEETILTTSDFHIISDLKTLKDIERLAPTIDTQSLSNEGFYVNLRFFAENRMSLADKSITYPEIAIPLTENQL